VAKAAEVEACGDENEEKANVAFIHKYCRQNEHQEGKKESARVLEWHPQHYKRVPMDRHERQQVQSAGRDRTVQPRKNRPLKSSTKYLDVGIYG
jgi:hypothetical protein